MASSTLRMAVTATAWAEVVRTTETSVTIQNEGKSACRVAVQAAAPTEVTAAGMTLKVGDTRTFTVGGSDKVFAIAMTRETSLIVIKV